jgi:putative ABC transport system permease protein
LIAVAVSMLLYIVPVQMPPPPGSSRGYPLNVTFDAGMYAATVFAMVLLAMLASAWIARKTVHTPIVDALAHT